MGALLVTACATQPRYDSSGAYLSYCNACGTIERIAKVRVRDTNQDVGADAASERGYRFDVQLEDGRTAQVTQLEKRGLRVGDSVMIRDEQVRLRR